MSLLGFFCIHFLGLIIACCMTLNIQAQDSKVLRLATTTSTENSGLLDYILPNFEQSSGYDVHVVAVGTGRALRMGKDGDADVLLVHAPAAEAQFMANGYGGQRVGVMVNDFILVGPKADPAGLKSATSISNAMQGLVDGEHLFVSRADDSGTHKKELDLWSAAQLEPNGSTYREAGQGMGKVLRMAGELDAYTLVDRGTWLAYRADSPLDVVFENDPLLFNPYSIISINAQRHPRLNHKGAAALMAWFVSGSTQQKIGQYTINGQVLFLPSTE